MFRANVILKDFCDIENFCVEIAELDSEVKVLSDDGEYFNGKSVLQMIGVFFEKPLRLELESDSPVEIDKFKKIVRRFAK